MIGLGSDKQCKRRWSLKNPDQKGSFKFQQEGPQWVCDMVRLWSDLGAIQQCLHQRHRLRRRPLLPLHPSLSRQLAGWWHDAGGAADDDGDAILMMMWTWWIWHYVGAIEQLAFFCQAVISWSASEAVRGRKHQRWKLPGLHLVHNLHKVLWQQHVFGEIFAMVQLQGLLVRFSENWKWIQANALVCKYNDNGDDNNRW